jgi:hypothetical protein
VNLSFLLTIPWEIKRSSGLLIQGRQRLGEQGWIYISSVGMERVFQKRAGFSSLPPWQISKEEHVVICLIDTELKRSSPQTTVIETMLKEQMGWPVRASALPEHKVSYTAQHIPAPCHWCPRRGWLGVEPYWLLGSESLKSQRGWEFERLKSTGEEGGGGRGFLSNTLSVGTTLESQGDSPRATFDSVTSWTWRAKRQNILSAPGLAYLLAYIYIYLYLSLSLYIYIYIYICTEDELYWMCCIFNTSM